MSQRLISHSPDLKRLRDEGYSVEVAGGYLVVRDVPYVNARREVADGILVCDLTLAGDVVVQPANHTAMFAGDHPCDEGGAELAKMKHGSDTRELIAGYLTVNHSFSARPLPENLYRDYHHKITTYVAMISAPAQAIDPTVTPKRFGVIESPEGESPFLYVDTASSRADIGPLNEKLALTRVAVVGLGGTGSYVLDLLAKTEVKEIHVFDGDRMSQHNAFRSPGAASLEDLRAMQLKVDYFTRKYSVMRRGILPHAYRITPDNADELKGMDFAFVCVDHGPSRRVVVDALEVHSIPFIDTGIGVVRGEGWLSGIVAVTTSTQAKRDHVSRRMSFGDADGDNEYARNIQVADLNALNAALAVLRWKRLMGFYDDQSREHFSAYPISGNAIINADFS